MSRIKAKDTAVELIVRRELFSRGLRYRTHVKDLPGTPDIAIKKHKVVIEVKGCFWHGHLKCVNGRIPKTNTEFWQNKIARNKLRDCKNETELLKMGFTVFPIWECEVMKSEILNLRITDFLTLINNK